jgi:hypothetical protein
LSLVQAFAISLVSIGKKRVVSWVIKNY